MPTSTQLQDTDPMPLTGLATVDYQKIAYEARDILNCGHVGNIPDALAKPHTRYNDALARIATLERESPNEKLSEGAP